METRDLRIGSYITYLDEIYNISGIRIEKTVHGHEYTRVWIKCNGLENAKTINWIKPIPITPQWLLDFGFILFDPDGTNNVGEVYSMDQYYCLLRHTGYFSFGINVIDHGFYSLKEIESIHELQNLFFSVNGEELKLNNNGKKC